MKDRLGLLLLVVLVVINALLVPLAFRHAAGPGGSGGAKPAGVRSPSPSAESASASPVPAAPRGAAEGEGGTSALLMSRLGRVIVRSTRGSCDGEQKASLEISANGGGSFETVELDPAVDEVLAVEVLPGRRVTVIGAGQDCEPVGYESTDGGATWKEVSPNGRWHLAADPSVRQVASPDGPMETPCAPSSMSTVRNDIVRLLCPDGRILRTLDDKSWVVAGRLDGATAIRFPVPSVGFAVAPAKACPAAVFRSTDSGRRWSRLTCLVGDSPRGIAGQDGRYVAQAGGVVEVSQDRGETWQRP